MSDIWDGLFESTSLNTDPNKPSTPQPKAVAVEPSAKTAPAKEPTAKRTRKRNNPVSATPVPDAPAEPPVDASIFFGSEGDDDLATAGATAQAQATLTSVVTGGEDDDDFDPFGEEGGPQTDAVYAAAFTVAHAVSTPEPVPTPTTPSTETQAEPKTKSKAGRPSGSKKKSVTVDQFVEKMQAFERGEPVAEKTFHGTTESDDRTGTEETTEELPKEIALLASAVTRIVLAEIAAFFSRSRG